MRARIQKKKVEIFLSTTLKRQPPEKQNMCQDPVFANVKKSNNNSMMNHLIEGFIFFIFVSSCLRSPSTIGNGRAMGGSRPTKQTISALPAVSDSTQPEIIRESACQRTLREQIISGQTLVRIRGISLCLSRGGPQLMIL